MSLQFIAASLFFEFGLYMMAAAALGLLLRLRHNARREVYQRGARAGSLFIAIITATGAAALVFISTSSIPTDMVTIVDLSFVGGIWAFVFASVRLPALPLLNLLYRDRVPLPEGHVHKRLKGRVYN